MAIPRVCKICQEPLRFDAAITSFQYCEECYEEVSRLWSAIKKADPDFKLAGFDLDWWYTMPKYLPAKYRTPGAKALHAWIMLADMREDYAKPSPPAHAEFSSPGAHAEFCRQCIIEIDKVMPVLRSDPERGMQMADDFIKYMRGPLREKLGMK